MNHNQNTPFDLTVFLDAARQMGFDGVSSIEGDRLCLCGEACRLAYEDLPEGIECFTEVCPELVALSKQIKWIVEDLDEAVPAKIMVSADGVICVQGPDDTGLEYDDDFSGWLFFPIQMAGVDDFKKLYPLIVDVLCEEDIDADELKAQSMRLYNLVTEAELRDEESSG